MKLKLLVLAVAAAFSASASAQVVISGKYLEVGVNNGGSLITFDGTGAYGVGTGIQFDPTGTGTFNSAKDIVTPGTPFAFYSVGANGSYGVAGAGSAANPFSVTTVAVGTHNAISESFGTVTSSGLDLTQTLTLNPNAKYFTESVTLSNNTGVAVNNVVYAVGIDPDNDIGFGGGYVTNNTILGTGTNAAVSATGPLSGETITLSNTSIGSAGVVANISAGWDTNPYNLLSNPSAANGPGDYTINLAYNLGTLAAGQSETIGYQFAVAAVPEPTEGALLLAGIGLLGFIAARRGRKEA